MSRYAEFEDYISSHSTDMYGFLGPFSEPSDYYPAVRFPILVTGRGRRTSRPARRQTTLRPSSVTGYFCCDDLECYNSGIPVSFENPTSSQFRDAVKYDLLLNPYSHLRSCSVYGSNPFDSPSRNRAFSQSMPLSSVQFQPFYDFLGDDPYSHLSNVHRRASEIFTARCLSQRSEVLVGDVYGFYSNLYGSPYSPYAGESSRGRDVYGDPWNSYPRGNQTQNYFHNEDDLYDEDKIYDEAGSSFPVGFAEYGFEDSF